MYNAVDCNTVIFSAKVRIIYLLASGRIKPHTKCLGCDFRHDYISDSVSFVIPFIPDVYEMAIRSPTPIPFKLTNLRGRIIFPNTL